MASVDDEEPPKHPPPKYTPTPELTGPSTSLYRANQSYPEPQRSQAQQYYYHTPNSQTAYPGNSGYGYNPQQGPQYGYGQYGVRPQQGYNVYYSQPPPQPVYVQRQNNRMDDGELCCVACLGSLLLCCTLQAIF